jgi:hypothetical protein
MKYIMCSRHFPKGHPKAGRPTGFVEKILYDLVSRKVCMKSKAVEWARATGIDEYHPMYYIDTFNQYECTMPKGHTIRPGSRFKPGEMVSLRVWSDKPYHSKQIEFAQVEVKRTWSIEINNRFGAASFEGVIDGKIFAQLHYGNDRDLNKDGLIKLAANDGLELEDFVDWFAIHPKKKEQVFKGQIICWSDEIDYTPDSKTIKAEV